MNNLHEIFINDQMDQSYKNTYMSSHLEKHSGCSLPLLKLCGRTEKLLDIHKPQPGRLKAARVRRSRCGAGLAIT